MVGPRFVAALAGVAFGFLISWGQFTDPDRIRDMLLLEDLYLYAMMFSAIAVSGLGAWLLLRRRARAVVTGEPIHVERARPERRHFVGAAIFGVGWAVVDSCPAPIAAQLSQGVWWSLCTVAGVVVGVLVYLRRQEAAARRSVAQAPAATPDASQAPAQTAA